MDWLFIPKVSLGPIKFNDSSRDVYKLLGAPSKVDIGENPSSPTITDAYSNIGLRFMYRGSIIDNKLVCFIVFPGEINVVDKDGTVLFPSGFIDGILHMKFDEVRIGDVYPYQIQYISHNKGVAMVLNAPERKYDLFSAHLKIK